MIDYDSLAIDNIATKLRSLFFTSKSKQIGRNYRPSKKLDTSENWRKAAMKCDSLGATPDNFIRAIFKFEVGKHHGGPYINHLWGQAVTDAYEKYMSDGVSTEDETQIKNEIASASTQCFSALTYRGLSADEYLLLDTVPVRAFVRLYLRPTSARIWRKYCDAAKLELMSDSTISTTLKELGFNTDKIYEFDRYD